MPDPSRWSADPLRVPLSFKLWFALCLLIGLGFLGVVIWAIIAVVSKVTQP